MSSSTPDNHHIVFRGNPDEDVFKFFFRLEHVVMKETQDQEKSSELFGRLDGRAFDYFFDNFADKDHNLKPEAYEYNKVKAAIIKEFDKPQSPEDDIHKAMELKIEPSNLLQSVKDMDRAFDKAGFNDTAKFGLLRKALVEFPEILQFVIYRGASDYTHLLKIIKEYDASRKTFFHQLGSSSSDRAENVFGSKKVLNRPDARGAEIESKIDSLTKGLENLTLIVKTKTPSQAQPSQGRGGGSGGGDARTCSFCKEQGHSANRCPKNPHRDATCERCGKMGHTIATCWSKPKQAQAPPVAGPAPPEERDGVAERAVPAANPAMVVLENSSPSDDDSDSDQEEVVAAVKRNAAGEALPKQVRFDGMAIENMLNPTPPAVAPQVPRKEAVPPTVHARKSSRKAKATARKPKTADLRKIIAERVPVYDVMQELAAAPCNMSLGQLVRGDAKDAEKILRRFFAPLRRRNPPVKKKDSAANAVMIGNNPKISRARCLKVVGVQVFATDVTALLDTGAVPNLISAELVDHLNLVSKETRKTITTADGSSSNCIGRLRNVPITFGHITVPLDFYVVRRTPLGLIVGIPSLEDMRAVLDLGSQHVDIRKGGEFVRLGLQPDTGSPFVDPENTESEIFTTESSSDDESAGDGNETESEDGDFIVALAKEGPGTDSDTDEEDEEANRAAILAAKLAHLTEDHARVVAGLLRDADIIAWSLYDLSAADVPVRHSFELKDYTPIYHRPRRMSPRDNEIVREEIDKMLKAGIIRPADSAWAFPVVIATKKDGGPRFCVDYRLLNARMVASRWPIPLIEEIFDELKGAVVYTLLDFFSGYWQFKMEEELKDFTTLTCRFGNFSFNVMPFGLMNAPSTFQKTMDDILKGLPFARAYLDDVIIYSESMEEHMAHLSTVFELIASYQFRLRVTKCVFCQDEVELLGHIVSKEGIRTDPSKIKSVRDAPTPTDKTGVRSFLGLAGYYRRFIKNFAGISAPLHPLTSPKTRFEWTPEAEEAFKTLKNALTSAPVLGYPDFDLPFIVETDASSHAVGAVLAQKQGGRVHPLQFASRSLNSAEKNYSACGREAVAVIFALRKFRVFLLSSHRFDLVTDHQALRHAFAKKDIHGRLARWMDFLAEYDYNVVYKAGVENKAADFLSRHAWHEPALESGDDEGQVAVVIEEPDLEPHLLDIKRHLEGRPVQVGDPRLRRNIRRASNSFLVWDHQLFRRTPHGPKVVVPRHLRERAIKMFHDSIGHWDGETTQQFLAERFWWPRMVGQMYAHIKSCKGCQLAAAVPKYRTTLRTPITGLFDTFSIDFAGPLVPGPQGERYLLIAVEHLSGWPMARATTSDTADVVRSFVTEEILLPFGPPGVFVSDNAKAFTAPIMQDLMETYGTKWRTVGEYAPMSNGRAERMVGTIKRAIAQTVLTEERPWTTTFGDVLYGYRRRRMGVHPSPFQLLYGTPPRMTPFDSQPMLVDPHDTGSREVENLAIQSARARRDQISRSIEAPTHTFSEGEQVLVAKAKSLGPLKMPPFESRWFGPCSVVTANHPLYELRMADGKKTRKPIHARRLKRWFGRNIVSVVLEDPSEWTEDEEEAPPHTGAEDGYHRITLDPETVAQSRFQMKCYRCHAKNTRKDEN